MATLKLPSRDQCCPERENCVKEQGQEVRPALEASRLADSEDVPHQQTQIQTGDVDEDSLEDVSVAAQMRPSHAAGLESVREGTLEKFAALSQQRLSSLATHSPTIAMHRVALFVLATCAVLALVCYRMAIARR